MYNLKIEFLSLLTEITDEDNINIQIENHGSLHDVIKELSEKYGDKFERKVLDIKGNLSKYIILAINGEQVKSDSRLDTLLHNGDEVSLIPAIAGG